MAGAEVGRRGVMGDVKTAVRNGIALAYTDTGSGDPPLLFVHGWACEAGHWQAQVTEFSQRHRVVAVDLRGHGESDKPDQDYRIAEFADDTLWLMRELGLERPVLVGHSMGGLIGFGMLRRVPDAVRALVLVDAPVIPLPEQFHPLVDQVLAGLKSPAYADVSRNFVGTMMFTQESDPALKEEIVSGMASAPQRLMLTALEDVFQPENLWEGPLPVPTLYVQAVAGETWDTELIKARHPDMDLDKIHCGHFVQLEQPAELNGMISKFLEKVI